MAVLLSLVGLALLVAGAELLVRGASALAARLGVSPLVVGLTVVAFGTSTPELATSLAAAFQHHPEMALGNAIGSNVFNVLVILGATAIVSPPFVASRLIRMEIPLMVVVSAGLYVLALNGTISRVEGALLSALLVAYVVLLVRASRRELAEVKQEFAGELARRRSGPLAAVGLVLLGLGGLVLGADWLLDGAVEIGRRVGLSERVIGLTLLAGGTSMPELATSVVAALRREPDIAVGNVVGSNLFNALGVVGATAALAPTELVVAPGWLRLDLPVMLASAAICVPMAFTGKRISRAEGAVLFAGWAAYLAWLLTANPGA